MINTPVPFNVWHKLTDGANAVILLSKTDPFDVFYKVSANEPKKENNGYRLGLEGDYKNIYVEAGQSLWVRAHSENQVCCWRVSSSGGGSATDWASITSKPTTIAGFGITDSPTTVSQLTNDLGFTSFDGQYSSLTGAPTLFDGQYSSLTGSPTIPTVTSQLTNDSGFITAADVASNAAVTANTAKNSYPTADATKLAGIETNAEVNPTNAEIVASINAGLGSTTWQGGGSTTFAGLTDTSPFATGLGVLQYNAGGTLIGSVGLEALLGQTADGTTITDKTLGKVPFKLNADSTIAWREQRADPRSRAEQIAIPTLVGSTIADVDVYNTDYVRQYPNSRVDVHVSLSTRNNVTAILNQQLSYTTRVDYNAIFGGNASVRFGRNQSNLPEHVAKTSGFDPLMSSFMTHNYFYTETGAGNVGLQIQASPKFFRYLIADVITNATNFQFTTFAWSYIFIVETEVL